MDFVSRTLSRQRLVLSAVLVVSAVGFWRASYDVFNTFKATVIIVGALAIVTLSAVRVSRTRRVLLPATRLWYGVGLFVVGLIVSTAVSDTFWRSVVGLPGRHTGLGMYLTYVVLFGAVLRLYTGASPAPIAKALMLAAVPVTLYGLLQAGGTDPFDWRTVEGGPPVFSTFGNANFFSAWLGICVPLFVWGGLTRSWATGWRAACAVGAVCALWASYASESIQGPAVAAVGTAFVLSVWLYSTAGERFRRMRIPLIAGGVALGALFLGAFFSGAGPLGAIRATAARSLETRVPKWETALVMWRQRPVLGYGLDTFGDWFFAFRSGRLAAVSGLERSVDNPHDVPLQMLQNGGLLLALGWLAFVAVTGYALVTGLRRLEGERRLLLGAFGGAWLGYLVQAVVSIDVPPLALLHFVLAGAVVALGVAPPLREFALPGAPAVVAPTERPGGKKRKTAKPRAVPLAPANPGLLAGVALLAVVGLWIATTPLRADVAAQRAVIAGANRLPDQARSAYTEASRIGFWESRYPALEGGWLAQTGDQEAALEVQQQAVEREPRGLAHTLNVARLHSRLGDTEAADAWYRRVLEIDPTTPEVLAEVGQYRLGRDDADEAAQALERAVALRGDNAEWWVALGRAREGAGDVDGARDAFQRALEINPDVPEAAEELAALA